MLPPNEIRYLSVAWEMWTQHSFLVPMQGGLPYGQKPPLLFWLVHLGWLMFGVNTWWPRLIPELFFLGSLGLTYLISRLLWPTQQQIAQMTPFILLVMLGWLGQLGLFKFDILLSCFVLSASYCLLRAQQQGRWFWWLLLGVSIALGVLAKGPVCLLFTLPIMLLAPWWSKYQTQWLSWGRYYRGVLLALLLAMILVLAWALPAVWVGGKDYARLIFWSQSAGRIAGQYGAHASIFTYLYMLIWMLLPWTLWLALWQGFRSLWQRGCQQYRQDPGFRFIAVALVPAFIILSLIPEKGERYIVPLLPWFALLFAYALGNFKGLNRRCYQWPLAVIILMVAVLYLIIPHVLPVRILHHHLWLTELTLSLGLILIVMAILLFLVYFKELLHNVVWLATVIMLIFYAYNLQVIRVMARHDDLRPLAQRLAQLERLHRPIAMDHIDFSLDFFGRLQTPTAILHTDGERTQWLHRHQNGWIVQWNAKADPQFVLLPVSRIQKIEE